MGQTSRTIVALVDGTSFSVEVFEKAMAAMEKGDHLLIIFARPVKMGDAHWENVMKYVNSTYDKKSMAVSRKFHEIAAKANVNFEYMEVEGFHPEEAIAARCQKIGVDVLFRAAPKITVFNILVAGPVAGNFCPKCNSFLRSGGRFAKNPSCGYKWGKTEFPCSVVDVKTGKRRGSKVCDI